MTPSSTRNRTAGSSSRSANCNPGASPTISVHDHETSESWLLDLANPDAKPRLVAPRETSVQYDVEHHPNWDGEERLVIRTNAGKARGLQGHAGAARRSGARELARSHPAPARHLRAQHHRALGLADPARARGLPSAHRGAPHRERRGAHHRISRRGLFAWRRRRLRVRDRPAALLLFVDDHAERGVGLRPEDARADACASARRFRAGTIRPPT